jgi:hypothetical protein
VSRPPFSLMGGSPRPEMTGVGAVIWECPVQPDGCQWLCRVKNRRHRWTDARTARTEQPPVPWTSFPSQPSTTEQHCTHVDDEAKRDAITKLNRLLGRCRVTVVVRCGGQRRVPAGTVRTFVPGDASRNCAGRFRGNAGRVCLGLARGSRPAGPNQT